MVCTHQFAQKADGNRRYDSAPAPVLASFFRGCNKSWASRHLGMLVGPIGLPYGYSFLKFLGKNLEKTDLGVPIRGQGDKQGRFKKLLQMVIGICRMQQA